MQINDYSNAWKKNLMRFHDVIESCDQENQIINIYILGL